MEVYTPDTLPELEETLSMKVLLLLMETRESQPDVYYGILNRRWKMMPSSHRREVCASMTPDTRADVHRSAAYCRDYIIGGIIEELPPSTDEFLTSQPEQIAIT